MASPRAILLWPRRLIACGSKPGFKINADGQPVSQSSRPAVSGNNLVMLCFGIVLGQVFAAFLGNNGSLVIGPGECPKRLDRLPKNDRDEFHFACLVFPKQVA